VQQAFTGVSICTRRSGTYLAPEPFPKAVMGDERIRTGGDAWQYAIGNMIAGPACCAPG
jgi:hypothetical protein